MAGFELAVGLVDAGATQGRASFEVFKGWRDGAILVQSRHLFTVGRVDRRIGPFVGSHCGRVEE